jgi:hypothetical protein
VEERLVVGVGEPSPPPPPPTWLTSLLMRRPLHFQMKTNLVPNIIQSKNRNMFQSFYTYTKLFFVGTQSLY